MLEKHFPCLFDANFPRLNIGLRMQSNQETKVFLIYYIFLNYESSNLNWFSWNIHLTTIKNNLINK